MKNVAKFNLSTERAGMPAVSFKRSDILNTGLLITADLYSCAEDALETAGLQETLKNYAKEQGMEMSSLRLENEGDNLFGLYAICRQGHIVLHINNETGYVSLDVYSYCPGAKPEKLVREMCSFLAPDKLKITYVERGDFGKKTDLKPRRRNRTRNISRVRNMTKSFSRLMFKPKSL